MYLYFFTELFIQINCLKELNFCCYDSYEIMMSCWRQDPSERPSFAELVTSIELELLNKEVRNEQSLKLKQRRNKIEIKSTN